jgi:hypothetical protein
LATCVLLELRCGLAAGVQVAALGERDQLLDDRAQFLGLGQRRLDLFVFDERAGHVGEHRLAVFMGPVQAAVSASVTHVSNVPSPFLLCPGRALRGPALLGAGLPRRRPAR